MEGDGYRHDYIEQLSYVWKHLKAYFSDNALPFDRGSSRYFLAEQYTRCNSEQKRKAIEIAYADILKPEVPMWHKDGSLMEWLQSL